MQTFALVDGNSFYCSCERAFDPTLKNKPLVVLSNNDGCAIARTDEAKALGIKMGDPYHLVAKKPANSAVIWKSSNYALYGDMSRRMHRVLMDYAPRVEPYSIDEMFLDFSGLHGDLFERSIAIREAVRRIAKIPTCVGFGPTKTIAKLANKHAKVARSGAGVCDMSDESARAKLYRDIGLDDVWGLGRASQAKLKALNVDSVADFVALEPVTVRDMLTVTGLRTHSELRGISCHPFSELPATRKTIACTRSFGRAVTSWDEMRDAIATYATRAAEKLRRFNMKACAMQVFMRTNAFNDDPKYTNGVSFALEATLDSRDLVRAATNAARALWRDGYRYAKAGVILIDLYRPQDLPIEDMFASREPAQSEKLMGTLDAINRRYGRHTINAGVIVKRKGWTMRQGNLSPCYTTRIEDVVVAKTL